MGANGKDLDYMIYMLKYDSVHGKSNSDHNHYYQHAWKIALEEIDPDKYSAIAAVGGDGTIHEVVKGMLYREDGCRLPLAFISKGTSNDTLRNFGVKTEEEALAFIAKSHTIKINVNRVTLDCVKPEDIATLPTVEKKQRFRYSVVNAAIGFIAEVVHKAINLKKYFGSSSYSVAGIKELFFTKTVPQYRLIFEQPNGSVSDLTVQTLMMMVNNGKYGGGHINFTPGAAVNEGLLDVVYHQGDFGVFLRLKFLKEAKDKHGSHVFRDDVTTYRAKTITIQNLNFE